MTLTTSLESPVYCQNENKVSHRIENKDPDFDAYRFQSALDNIKNVIYLPTTCSEWIWKIGDNSFQLSASLIALLQQRYDINRFSESGDVDNQTLSALAYYLNPKQNKLPVYQLLGPASAFCAFYATLSRLLGHTISNHSSLACQPLAVYIAAGCDSLIDGPSPLQSVSRSSTWQTSDIAIGPEAEDLFIDICSRQGDELTCRAPPEVGLPNLSPLYGPRSESNVYWLAPQSTTLYRSDLKNPFLNHCALPGNNNYTLPDSPQNSALLYLDVDNQRQRANVAVVSGSHPLIINTQESAQPILVLSGSQRPQSDNMKTSSRELDNLTQQTINSSTEISPPSFWNTASTAVAHFLMFPAADARLPPSYLSPWRPKFPEVTNKSELITTKEYLYQLNNTEEDGSIYKLFSRPDTLPSCLANIPAAPQPAVALTLLEMVNQLHAWVAKISTDKIERAIHAYILQKTQARGIGIIPSNAVAATHAFIELIICFEITLTQTAANGSMAYSSEETQKFLSPLLADTPFAHNEELQSTLVASSLAEPLLGKLLFKALAHTLPIGAALLDMGYQRTGFYLAEHGKLTYAGLNTLLSDIQNTFKTNLIQSVQDKFAYSGTLIEERHVNRILFWHQRMLEYAYPFMLLRNRQDIQEIDCLSREGLLINLGVLRLGNVENHASLSAKELRTLGQDLLLNSSIEQLVDECSALENLYRLPGQAMGRGIYYHAEQLKREGVLVLRYTEAKRELATQISHPVSHIVTSSAAYQHYIMCKRQLYSFALQSLPAKDQQRFIDALTSVSTTHNTGIELRFVRLGNSNKPQGYRPYMGFILSCAIDTSSQHASAVRQQYFISLMPIQSDTTRALAFDLSTELPESFESQEGYLNSTGKRDFLTRLSIQIEAEPTNHRLYLEQGGNLDNLLSTGGWPQIADRFAAEIIHRQFINLTPSLPIQNDLHPANIAKTEATKGSWFTRLVNQLIYLTPLGNCKDALTEARQGHRAAMVLDGAFCLYAFFPGGSEEELGVMTVANVIKNTLKSLIEKNAETEAETEVKHVVESPGLLGKIEQTLQAVEQELQSAPLSLTQAKHCLTANPNLKALLLSPALYTSITLGEIPQDFVPVTVWREPLHDVLYFLMMTGVDTQAVYRLDEANQLLLPNPSAALKSMILRESEQLEMPIMRTALNSGNTQQLRFEIYQHERMSGIEHHALTATATAPANGVMIYDNKPTGRLYYPAIKLAGSDSLYLLTLAGIEDDQQLVVKTTDGRLSYWRDNAITIKKIRPQALAVTLNDPYQNLVNTLENTPAGWTLDKIWVDQSEAQHIIVTWSDAEGNLHFRQPNRVGKWLPWDNHQRTIFCRRVTREKRNPPDSSSGITEIFSPEHCGYLALPRITDPDRAAALDEITQQFNNLRPPLIFDTLDCINQAKAISHDFMAIWDTFPVMLRELISGIRFSKIDVKNYHNFDVAASVLKEHSAGVEAVKGLSCEQKAARYSFLERLRVLILDFKKLQDNSLQARTRYEDYSASLQQYYDKYIVKNLKFNHWINRWFERWHSSDKIHSSYIIKASTSTEIAQKYPFLYQGARQAIEVLQSKARQITTMLSDKTLGAEFASHVLSAFFGEDFSTEQCLRFTFQFKQYLQKIRNFTVDNIVVVADRFSGKRLASGCLNTPLEKIAFGDGAYSFVYNSFKDKNVYLFDYLSNHEFIEYALAHELGHLTFDNIKYVIQNEIYLKAGAISKNFNIFGASKFARHLMSDKAFFLDYVSKNKDFAYAFYRHFKAHSTHPSHKNALENFYNLMLDEDSSNPLYLHDKAMRKNEMARLVDMFFALPGIKLDITYYNPDLFSGLFGFAYQQTLNADGNNNRLTRSVTQEQQSSESVFGELIIRALHEKYIT